MNGTSLDFLVNGALIFTYTDTFLTNNTKVGLYDGSFGYIDSASNGRIDNFSLVA